MTDGSNESPTAQLTTAPQFATAEYTHIPGTERCRICNNLIGGDYYRVNGQMACAQCAADARSGQPRDSHSAFTRGLLLGIGAAILGMAAYATFTIITGWYIGYLALGVGYLVAKAIMKGSNGLGGRRYQIAAVLLTYAAISLAAVPIAISNVMHDRKNTASHANTSASPDASSPDSAAEANPNGDLGKLNLGPFIGQLLLFGLASPFMELRDPLQGALGLFILFIGLRIAWRTTAARPLEVSGPWAPTNAIQGAG